MGSLGEDWISFKALRRLFLSGVCCLFETFARLKNMGTFGEDWMSFKALRRLYLSEVRCSSKNLRKAKHMGTFGEDWMSKSLAKVVLERGLLFVRNLRKAKEHGDVW